MYLFLVWIQCKYCWARVNHSEIENRKIFFPHAVSNVAQSWCLRRKNKNVRKEKKKSKEFSFLRVIWSEVETPFLVPSLVTRYKTSSLSNSCQDHFHLSSNFPSSITLIKYFNKKNLNIFPRSCSLLPSRYYFGGRSIFFKHLRFCCLIENAIFLRGPPPVITRRI